MPAAFKEGSRKQTHDISASISLARTYSHGPIYLQGMLGNVVFILFWKDFCPAKNGDSYTVEKRETGY